MIRVRRSEERGHANHGWLDSHHTFSFANYYDPEHMGFGALRVINDDRVAPGEGFGKHPHRDMEILTYVVEGALEHKDSMGTGSVIRPGDLQRMSAGTGVAHSEYNHSRDEPVRFLQIWIVPERRGLEPSYAQKRFEREGRLTLVASPDGRDGALTVHQDVALYAALLDPGATVTHSLATGRRAWLQLVDGEVTLTTSAGSETLRAGDGAAIERIPELRIEASAPTNLLLFDLA